MQLMLTNMGTVPLPMASSEEGGWAENLPCGLRVPFYHPRTAGFTLGYDPADVRLGVRDATEAQTAQYQTYVHGWLGRDDPPAGTEMAVDVLVECFEGEVVLTTSEGDVTITRDNPQRISSTNFIVALGTASEGPGGGDGGGGTVTVEITGFTAQFDTTATSADTSMLDAGDTITLTAVAGTPESMAAIEGASGTVFDLTASTFRIQGLDLSGADVTDLAATGTVAVVADNTGTITAFTAANPTTASMDAEDAGLLVPGDSLMLEALTGDQAAMDAINGVLVEVLTVTPAVTLGGVDLSALDVTGLTADFVVV